MTDLLFWMDGPADGHVNMAADEMLAAEAVRQNRPLARFYRWSERTFSLGGFQRLEQARAEPAIASLPLVRRPSGGGGIVHGSDLTYAIAVPRDHPWGGKPQVLYDTFHEALADVLASRGIPAELHPGPEPHAKDEERLYCFDRRARGDIVVPGPSSDGHKLLGSAQRRLKSAVLQHGSLLLDTPQEVGKSAAHRGLADLYPAARHWSQESLVAAWLGRIREATGTEIGVGSGSFATCHVDTIAAAALRFGDPAWLGRR